MKQIDDATKLKDIVNLQTELKLQEGIYNVLLNADEPFYKLKPVRHKIKELKKALGAFSDVVILDTLS